jgi:hypothetical protein
MVAEAAVFFELAHLWLHEEFEQVNQQLKLAFHPLNSLRGIRNARVPFDEAN